MAKLEFEWARTQRNVRRPTETGKAWWGVDGLGVGGSSLTCEEGGGCVCVGKRGDDVRAQQSSPNEMLFAP